MSWCAAAVIASVLLCAPQVADACAVCLSATDEYRDTFAITTALLTALPLLMVGSIILWLRRRFLRLEQQSAPRPAIAAQVRGISLQARRTRRAQRRPKA